jgi:hypothetical protein
LQQDIYKQGQRYDAASETIWQGNQVMVMLVVAGGGGSDDDNGDSGGEWLRE